MFKSRCGYAFTPIAEQDLDQIFEYISINLSSPMAAGRLIDKMQEAVVDLCDFPLSRRLVDDLVLREQGYHILIVDNFNLFYKLIDNSIVVMRVLYGGMYYQSVLE